VGKGEEEEEMEGWGRPHSAMECVVQSAPAQRRRRRRSWYTQTRLRCRRDDVLPTTYAIRYTVHGTACSQHNLHRRHCITTLCVCRLTDRQTDRRRIGWH